MSRWSEPVRRPFAGWRLPVVFYTHPFELILGMALVVNGFAGLAGYPSPSIAEVPWWPQHAYLVSSTLGGATLVWALAHRDETHSMQGAGRAIERAALFLVATGYGGLGAVILILNSPRGIATAVVAILVALACLLRAIAIRRTTQIVLRQLEGARRDDEAGR